MIKTVATVVFVCSFASSALSEERPCAIPAIRVTGGTSMSITCGADFGHFEGKPQTEWLDDGRNMRLLEDFTYVDPDRKTWTAPKNSEINGASIPPVLWSIVGGPYEGQYRNASVVHDTECTPPHKNKWRDVHRMFYYGTRAGGVGWIKGMLMYAAVYKFGLRWTDPPPQVAANTNQIEIFFPALQAVVNTNQTFDFKDFLIRLLVVLRKDTTQAMNVDDVEKLTYPDLLILVPNTDPDLADVRSLLTRRAAAESSESSSVRLRTLAEIDSELFSAKPVKSGPTIPKKS